MTGESDNPDAVNVEEYIDDSPAPEYRVVFDAIDTHRMLDYEAVAIPADRPGVKP